VSRGIVLVAYPDVQLLDVVGPLEVFDIANRKLAGHGRSSEYDVKVVAATDEPIRGTSGLDITPHRALGDLRAPFDTVMVAGGEGTVTAATDEDLLAWLRRVAPKTRRMASVCSGAFVLAAAGLLDGKRATTHWSVCDLLAELFPAVTVEPDPIFVRDGNVSTSAGVTAGMDLALAFVEEDLGREIALEVARQLVLFVRRPGGQSQFSAQLAHQHADREPLQDVQAYIADHPDADLSVAALAEHAAMSPRTFARTFRVEVGTTPAVYVERVRVECARRLLETTDVGSAEIAHRAGFGTVETMRRAFARRLGVAPSDYRDRFRIATP
jgi:transcriptional regulator GlxA family with amidase domain